jgi:hypothetical protein
LKFCHASKRYHSTTEHSRDLSLTHSTRLFQIVSGLLEWKDSNQGGLPCGCRRFW